MQLDFTKHGLIIQMTSRVARFSEVTWFRWLRFRRPLPFEEDLLDLLGFLLIFKDL